MKRVKHVYERRDFLGRIAFKVTIYPSSSLCYYPFYPVYNEYLEIKDITKIRYNKSQ